MYGIDDHRNKKKKKSYTFVLRTIGDGARLSNRRGFGTGRARFKNLLAENLNDEDVYLYLVSPPPRVRLDARQRVRNDAVPSDFPDRRRCRLKRRSVGLPSPGAFFSRVNYRPRVTRLDETGGERASGAGAGGTKPRGRRAVPPRAAAIEFSDEPYFIPPV